MSEVICNEVLFFVQNNFGKVGVNNLATVISGFYDETELCAAKTALHAVAAQQCQDDPEVPRLKTRRAGDNKRRLDADDILGLFACLDAKKVTLPTFAAVKSSRLPSIKPSDADLCFLTASVAELRDQVAVMMCSLKALVDNNVNKQVAELSASVSQLRSQLAEVVSSIQATSTTGAVNLASHQLEVPAELNEALESAKPCQPSWSDLAGNLNYNGSDWVTKKVKKDRRVIRGTAQKDTCTLTSSVEEKVWHVFASKLHPDTSVDDLSDFLADSGIRVLKCDKLDPKEEWQRKSAAFHVQVDYKDKDSVFNDTLWPKHVIVRDWYFKTKRTTSIAPSGSIHTNVPSPSAPNGD
jgi:hypothetical protein